MNRISGSGIRAYTSQALYKIERVGACPGPDVTEYSASLGSMDAKDIEARIWRLDRETCPYCRTPLDRRFGPARGEERGLGTCLGGWWVLRDYLSTEVCRRCGWWCKRDILWKQTSWEDDFIHTSQHSEAVAALFDITSSNLPLRALRLHLAAHPHTAEHVSPTVFERLVGDVYRDFLDCEVIHVGRSGDQGVDLLAVISDEPTLLQVKRTRAGTLRGGPEIVRALMGACLLAGARRACLVTSAARFTKATIETAERAGSLSYHKIQISLLGLEDLINILKLANENDEFVWQTAGDQ